MVREGQERRSIVFSAISTPDEPFDELKSNDFQELVHAVALPLRTSAPPHPSAVNDARKILSDDQVATTNA